MPNCLALFVNTELLSVIYYNNYKTLQCKQFIYRNLKQKCDGTMQQKEMKTNLINVRAN